MGYMTKSLQRVGYGSNFNEIVIRGEAIVKRSINPYGDEKITNEIAFYEYILKNKLRVNVPNIYHLDKMNHTIVMLYMKDYIALYMIYFDLPDKDKFIILRNIYKNLVIMHSEQIRVHRDVYWNDLHKETIDKVESRLSSIQHLIKKNEHILTVNGEPLKKIKDILTKINTQIKKHVREQTEYVYSFIHGDCQFNNILCSIDDADRTRIVFIDPRGYYGDTKLYGIPEYDYAKILFALSGYDLFDNAVVDDLRVDGNNVVISDFIQHNFYDVFESVSPLPDIVTTLFVCIWLGNAHMFINNEAKCMTSYFIAMYYASTYL